MSTSNIPTGNINLTGYATRSCTTYTLDLYCNNTLIYNNETEVYCNATSYSASLVHNFSCVNNGNINLTGYNPTTNLNIAASIPSGIISLTSYNPTCYTVRKFDQVYDNCTTYIYREKEITMICKDTKAQTIVVDSDNDVVVVNNLTKLVPQGLDTGVIVEQDYTTYITESCPNRPLFEGEDDIMYASRVDFISDNLLYRGEAQPGTLDNESKWRIRKITISAVDDDVVQTWADGTDAFTKSWNNRLIYTYT